ncbi:unnamed protein product [Linum trigynum]|uniref:Uncharacterized protein n=1 Tax=Linum trigynum TaxID=586398 RepID=A0AAV2G5F3_9ROSI
MLRSAIAWSDGTLSEIRSRHYSDRISRPRGNERRFPKLQSSSQRLGNVPNEYLMADMACPLEEDSESATIGKFMTGMKHLELRFSRLTTKGIESISEGCLNLEFLELSGCVNVRGTLRA